MARRLARMAARAGLGEYAATLRQGVGVGGEIGVPSRRLGQPIRLRRFQEKQGRGWRALLGGPPISRVGDGRLDLDRGDRLATDDRVEMGQPFLAEQADVEIDAVECTQCADGIRAILEHPWRPNLPGGLEELGQRTFLDEVVELLVVPLPTGQLLVPEMLGDLQARAQVVDRVHGARVIDVVGGHQRGVHRPGPVGPDELIHEVSFIGFDHEQPVNPHVLSADRRAEVGKLRIRRIGRGIARAWSDMAEAAGHAYPVGAHQARVAIVDRILVVALRIPGGLGLRVEFRIGKQPQAEDAGRLAIIGPDREAGPIREFGSARADLDAWILLGVGEGIRGTIGAPHVQPQAESGRIARGGRGVETGLVDQPQDLPAPRALQVAARWRGDDLEHVEATERWFAHRVPEPVIAAGPHVPHIAALDLLG